MTEIWKDIEGYEGEYMVSNLGNVKSLKYGRERIMNAKIIGGRYKQVALSKDGYRKVFSIHRLVAKAFIPNPNNYEFVNHKNWDREDNSVNNLEWCTRQYNNENRSNCLKFRT